jgi:hypothetical protein
LKPDVKNDRDGSTLVLKIEATLLAAMMIGSSAAGLDSLLQRRCADRRTNLSWGTKAIA